MSVENKKVVLTGRPVGESIEECFSLKEEFLYPLLPKEVLIKNLYLSVDPYLRLRMNDAKSYMPPQSLGETMEALSVGVVEQSNSKHFQVGDYVTGLGGWQTYYRGIPATFRKIDVSMVPLTAHLGVLGATGITAWYGVNRILSPKAGSTIIVNAASGAVGSVAGQLIQLAGAKVIGVAGGREKCSYVVDELGFDACLDYKSSSFENDLDTTLGDKGIDGVFENVGGHQLDLFMERMNPFARVVLCGLISGGYDARPLPIANANHFLTSRIMMQGFIIHDHLDVWPEAIKKLTKLVASNSIKWKETVDYRIESVTTSFTRMLHGGNIGKQLVALQ